MADRCRLALEVLLFVIGIGLGTIFPVTTVTVQNAVPPHQLGTATAALNFFRSLGGAILVAAVRRDLLASAGTVGGG